MMLEEVAKDRLYKISVNNIDIMYRRLLLFVLLIAFVLSAI
jgi:hypothetical protein